MKPTSLSRRAQHVGGGLSRGYVTTMYWNGASLGVRRNIAGPKCNLVAVAKNCTAIVAATLSYQTDQSTTGDGQATP